MSWEKVDDKLKKGRDALFVSCEESYELKYIKDVIKEAFPGKFTDAKLDAAIKACCQEVAAPRPRKRYIECLKKKLV